MLANVCVQSRERPLRVPARWWMLAVIAWAVSGPANANNGLNMIGFGAESIGMGGADVAVARDTGALNTNPAGITALKRPAFDGDAAVAFATNVAHADILGNDQRVDNWYIMAGSFGFTAPLAPGLVAGIGVFAQGGAGNVYKNLRTPFDTTDELSAQIGFAKLAPALAWQATDELSVAVSVPIAAILAKQRVFPNASVYNPANPTQNFFGLDLKNARGVGAGVKLGALWHASPALSIGLTGSSRINLTADDGNATVNMTAAGLGIVHYGAARLEGFALPPEVAVGAAWQVTDRTLISAEITQLWWSNALRSTSLTLTQPDNPDAPPVLSQTAVVNARDQTVFAAGIAHELDNQLTLYGGLNYGRNPIPPENLTPLIAAIGEWHITGGFRTPLDPGWAVSGAFEYLLPKTIQYDNRASPLGPSTERVSYIAFHLMLSRRW